MKNTMDYNTQLMISSSTQRAQRNDNLHAFQNILVRFQNLLVHNLLVYTKL